MMAPYQQARTFLRSKVDPWFRQLLPFFGPMHIAPNAHEHTNTKGVITIDVARRRDRLLGGGPPTTGIRNAI